MWVSRAAPFWLDVAGTLALDATIGVQFLIFDKSEPEKVVLMQDREGRSRWRRFNPWMRGCIPSPSPSPSASMEIDEGKGRRLLESRESRGSCEGMELLSVFCGIL